MQETEHGHILDLIPAYALGSLDADEMAQVTQHLPDCAACREELDAYQQVVDLLPLAAPGSAPSPLLKTRLMAGVGTPEHSLAKTARKPAPRLTGWARINEALQRLLAGPRWQPASLLLIAILAVGNLLLWRQLSLTTHDLEREIELSGTETAPEATGVIYVSTNGRNGTLIVEQLPPLTPEQQYQLWLVRDGERDNGGVFSVSENGYHSLQISSPRPLEEYGAFGITIEPAGGSPGPTGQRVLGTSS